ncbi:MAG: glycosyltransferase family 39 protein [Candidatus Vogelbacteria bacterium]|nr:glycosyltransferase family 39 protein [Candidatus Vogelbacteria bacterium]
MFKESTYQNKLLTAILALSFLLSAFYSFYFKIVPVVDAAAYDRIAQNIVNGNGYREDMSVDILHDYSISRVGPVYEYFLAVVFVIFGHSYQIVWIIQAFLHVLTVYLIYMLCLEVFPELENRNKVALIAGAIFGFYPDLIEISSMLMGETLYLFFTCALIYLFFRYLDNQSLRNLLSLSFVAGVSVLVRPPIILFLPILSYATYKKVGWSHLLSMAAIILLVFTPWTIRNYSVFHVFMPFGTAGQLNFWIGNHPGSNGEQEAGPVISDFIASHAQTDIQIESMKQFIAFLASSPVEFLKLTLLRINKYFSILRPMGFWFYTSGWRQWLFVLCSAVFSIIVSVLSLSGIIKLLGTLDEKVKYLFLFTFITPLLLFITVIETRYRFQIYPFLAIFAAYFVCTFQWGNRIEIKILTGAFSAIMVNGLLDGLINFSVFYSKIIQHLR